MQLSVLHLFICAFRYFLGFLVHFFLAQENLFPPQPFCILHEDHIFHAAYRMIKFIKERYPRISSTLGLKKRALLQVRLFLILRFYITAHINPGIESLYRLIQILSGNYPFNKSIQLRNTVCNHPPLITVDIYRYDLLLMPHKP